MNYWHYLRGVPYPSDPERARKAAAAGPRCSAPPGRHPLRPRKTGTPRASTPKSPKSTTGPSSWNVPVICNEFGVYRKYADPQDRAAWITDVRTALEKHNIGWAMWDYSGGFGLVTKENGKTVVDDATVKALGLKMP